MVCLVCACVSGTFRGVGITGIAVTLLIANFSRSGAATRSLRQTNEVTVVALPWTRWYGCGATLDDDEADCLFLLIVASCSVFSLRGRLRDSDGSDAAALFFVERGFSCAHYARLQNVKSHTATVNEYVVQHSQRPHGARCVGQAQCDLRSSDARGPCQSHDVRALCDHLKPLRRHGSPDIDLRRALECSCGSVSPRSSVGLFCSCTCATEPGL